MVGQQPTVFDATRTVEAVQTLAPQIRDASVSMEAERCLPPALVHAMKKAGIFRIAWSKPRCTGRPGGCCWASIPAILFSNQ